ncbi:hypothetical protein COO60DRAFT_215875 [Scenedesmus sp. NREL 46B-D3]|nr:hypothetical protein COO60DRAFT_215875 [Scenedesmus sp. NREL 46B-D3]
MRTQPPLLWAPCAAAQQRLCLLLSSLPCLTQQLLRLCMLCLLSLGQHPVQLQSSRRGRRRPCCLQLSQSAAAAAAAAAPHRCWTRLRWLHCLLRRPVRASPCWRVQRTQPATQQAKQQQQQHNGGAALPAPAAAAAAAAAPPHPSSTEELLVQGLALSRTYDPLLVRLALQPQRTSSTPHALQPLSAILPAAGVAAAPWAGGLPALPGRPAAAATGAADSALQAAEASALAAAELAVAAAATQLAARDAAAAAAATAGLEAQAAAAAVATAEAAAGLAAAVGAESLAALSGAVPLSIASEEVLQSNLAAAAAALDELDSPLARQRTGSISLTAGLSAAPGDLDAAAAAAAGVGSSVEAGRNGCDEAQFPGFNRAAPKTDAAAAGAHRRPGTPRAQRTQGTRAMSRHRRCRLRGQRQTHVLVRAATAAALAAPVLRLWQQQAVVVVVVLLPRPRPMSCTVCTPAQATSWPTRPSQMQLSDGSRATESQQQQQQVVGRVLQHTALAQLP